MSSIPIENNNSQDKYTKNKSVDDVDNNKNKKSSSHKKNNKEESRSCTEALQQNAFALPSVVALLVVAVVVLCVALMAVNTDKAVGTVVDSLQDQVLALANSRFDQQLAYYMEIANDTAADIVRLNVPFPANDANPYVNGFADTVDAFDKNINAYQGIDNMYAISPSGRQFGVTRNRPGLSMFYFEDWRGAPLPRSYVHLFPARNSTKLAFVDNSAPGAFSIPMFAGITSGAWGAIDPIVPNAYAWTPPRRVQGGGTVSLMNYVVAMHKQDGTFYGLCAASIDVSSLQKFFKELKPTPRTIAFLLEPDNNETLIASSVGDTILDAKGDRLPIKDAVNITVLQEAGRAIPDYRTVKSQTRATFKVNGELWRLSAKPFTSFGNNFVLAVATPDEEFSGEVDKATRNTIIICVVVTVVVLALIIYLSIQQHRLVQSSEQSVLVSKAVSSHLLEYDTDSAEETLNAASQATFVNQITGDEQPNYVNQNLVYTLRQIVENLMMYRPHLPSYVLPQQSNMGTSDEIDADNKQLNDDEVSIDMYSNDGRSENGLRGTANSNNNKRGSVAIPKKSSVGGDDLAADPNNPFFVANNNKKDSSRGSTSSRISGSTATSNSGAKSQITRVAMLRDSGSYVERVVLGNLNLSRIPEIVFPLSQGVKGTTVKYVNRIIELILDNAAQNDATVHSLVGDSLQVSWNGTQRTAHADVKACRFVTKTEISLKKEISEWLKDPAAQKGVVPIFNTRKALLTGGLAHGAAWCQLGGSNTKQQFMMLNFSEQNRMKSAFELGIKYKFVSVCHVMNQNVQHEFLLNGAGLHFLPGGHAAFFGFRSARESCADMPVNDTPNQEVVAAENHHQQPHQSTGGEDDKQNNSKNSPVTATTTPVLQNDGKTFLATPIFELVSRKKLMNEDEWLYVVGDGNATNKTTQAQICSALTDTVMALCKGNREKAVASLEKAKHADENCVYLGAYQSLEKLTNALCK